MARVILVSGDILSRRMGGPGIRSLELARCLAAAGHDVTLAAPHPIDRDEPGLRLRGYADGDIAPLVDDHDVAVVQGFILNTDPRIARSRARLVVDLYDPFHLETLVLNADAAERDQWMAWELNLGVLSEQLRRGSFFICASERQRAFWLGALATVNRVNPATFGDDATMRRLIDVVAFGLPAEPALHRDQVMRGVIPGIGLDDYVLLWGGGLYDWLDPETLIDGVARAATRLPHLRLVFHAGRHPNDTVAAMPSLARARDLAGRRGLLDRHVFFNDEWVTYDRRADWLLEADVGVSTHRAHLESEFSFRTRILDYLWCGLPVLCTEGDSLAALVAARGLGITVPERAPEAIASAIERLAVAAERAACANNIRGVSPTLAWPCVAQPLLQYCARPWDARDRALLHRTTPVPLRGWPTSSGLQARARRALRLLHAESQRRGTRAAMRLVVQRVSRSRGGRHEADA